MTQFRAIIFDFDFTLASSFKGVVRSTNYALEKMGLPIASSEAIKATIGYSLQDSLIRLAGEENANRGDEYTKLFVDKADEVMADCTVVYDFVPEVLETIKALDMKLGIVTTKYRYRILQVMEREGLLDYFNVIVGGDDVSNHKPDPESIHKALKKLGIPYESCLYVGDSIVDAEAAQRAGVPFVAVLSGTTSREAFSKFKAQHILDSASEIMSVVK